VTLGHGSKQLTALWGAAQDKARKQSAGSRFLSQSPGRSQDDLTPSGELSKNGRIWGTLAAVFYCVMTVVLSACAFVPQISELSPITHVDTNQVLTGYMVVTVAQHGADPGRTLNAHFELRGRPQQGTLDLSTPLGSLLAQAHWGPEGAWLRSSRGETHFVNLEALTYQMLGDTLPLSALFDWLCGQPWGVAPYQALDASESNPNPRSGFTQMGWRIDLSRWTRSVVVATRLKAPVVTMRVKLERS
jgi:outer membrane lipoprotein LolB